MRKLAILFVFFGICSLANGTIYMDHWSPLTIVETIIDIGDGNYRYEYSFTNVDFSPIWGFGICTNFLTQAESTFTAYPAWGYGVDLIENTAPEYDARNLDTKIVMLTGTTCFLAPGHEIQIGEVASGFSFSSPTYDPSPKYYFYETITSGYTQTNGTGKVAAIGLTIPEPATVCLLAFGGVLLRHGVWRNCSGRICW